MKRVEISNMRDLRFDVPLRNSQCPICEEQVEAGKDKAVSFSVGRSTTRIRIHKGCVKAMKAFLDDALAEENPDGAA